MRTVVLVSLLLYIYSHRLRAPDVRSGGGGSSLAVMGDLGTVPTLAAVWEIEGGKKSQAGTKNIFIKHFITIVVRALDAFPVQTYGRGVFAVHVDAVLGHCIE